MALKLVREELEEGESAKAVFRYEPEATCFNWEGVEHFGTNCDNCKCESCKKRPKE